MTPRPSAATDHASPRANVISNSAALMASPPAQPQHAMADLPHGLLDAELLPKYRRDLVGKLRAMRTELQTLQPQSGHCRLVRFLKLF